MTPPEDGGDIGNSVGVHLHFGCAESGQKSDMKKVIISSVLGLLICALVMYFGVWNTQKNLKVERNNSVKISTASKISIPNNTKTNTSSVLKVNDFKKYLNITRKEIMAMEDIKDDGTLDDGTVSLMESHMFFPCIYSKKHGLSFIFPTEESSEKPTYLYMNQESNKANNNIKDAKPGMKFEEIFSYMGKTSVKKTWLASEDNTAYKIDYQLDGLIYSFVSNEEDGNGSELYISLAE